MDHLDEIAQLKAIIEQQQATLKEQEKQIAEKDLKIEQQQIRLDAMMQALLHARKKMYGRSSEVSKECEGQFHLFETNNEFIKELIKEQKKITIEPYTRTPRKAGVRAEMLEHLPQEVDICTIPADDSCTICGSELKVIGKEIVRTEVELIPAKVIVKQIVREIAKCTLCGTNASENPKDHFQKAKVPTKMLSHTIATPSLIAHVMYQKFALGLPFNRQEKEYFRMGLVLPRRNMAHWTIRCCEDWFTPLYERIRQKLLLCESLHMDESRMQVNKEEGRKASTHSFVWVIQSGNYEDVKASYFHYSPSRSSKIAIDLLKGFEGYLTTDAYIAYQKVEGIKNNFCWAHCRRYLVESIPLDSNGKEIPGSKGAEGRERINLLFKVERKIADLSPEERKQKRLEASKPILEAFWSWVDETTAIPTHNEELTKALNYAKNQRQYLETFLEDGRLEISNNLCEAHIKAFATARRAWLFADTPNGARANAIMYTLTESAKANNLNIYEYLKYLLSTLPELDFNNQPELLDGLLPWSDSLPVECQMKQIRKKCLK